MNYATIKPICIENGPGIRVSLFVSGCRRACKGCFNSEAWDFNYGQEFTEETMEDLMRMLGNQHVSGLSILGGDPFEPENVEYVEAICQCALLEYPEKNIWVWTGLHYEDVKDLSVMQYIDILVDGPFVEELKDISLPYCGSSNQRVIDVQRSLASGEVVEWWKKDA